MGKKKKHRRETRKFIKTLLYTPGAGATFSEPFYSPGKTHNAVL